MQITQKLEHMFLFKNVCLILIALLNGENIVIISFAIEKKKLKNVFNIIEKYTGYSAKYLKSEINIWHNEHTAHCKDFAC